MSFEMIEIEQGQPGFLTFGVAKPAAEAINALATMRFLPTGIGRLDIGGRNAFVTLNTIKIRCVVQNDDGSNSVETLDVVAISRGV